MHLGLTKALGYKSFSSIILQTAMFGSIGAIIGVVFVGILVLLCACGCCFFAARKFL